MKRLLDLPVDRPIATGTLLVSILILGSVAVVRLPLDFMPALEEPEISIEVPYPGGHPLETLHEILRPLEEEVATIGGVRSTWARADASSASLEVRFSWSDPLDLKKLEVREAVDRARSRMPDGVGSIRVEADTAGPAGGAIIEGRISAARDLSESWDLLDRRIRRPLERIQGVARVSLYGVEPQQLRIDLHLAALRAHGLQPSVVRDAVTGANVELDAGALRGDVLRWDVRAFGRLRTPEQVAALPLGAGGLRVGDVAHVALEEPELDYGRHLDGRFAIGIDVFREPTANTVETVEQLMARIEAFKDDPELAGITLLVWENAAEQILNSLRGLRDAGVVGGLLAALVLHAFLRRWWTTVVVTSAIPFSLLATCGAMYALDSQLDVLTMLGLMLGVGMLVDNAVVVMENIHRKSQLGVPPVQAAREGAREVALAVIASTATTVIVWSWLLVLPRDEMTILMGEVALTISLAVCCSLLVALTFIPMAAAHFLPRSDAGTGFVLRRVVPAYQRVLAWTLRHRAAALTGLILVAATSAIPFSLVEKSGEPRIQERAVAIWMQVHDPATKEALEKHVNVVEAWLETKREEIGYESTYSWYSETQGCMTRVYLPPDRLAPKEIARVRKVMSEGLPVIPGVTMEVAERNWWRHRGRGDRRLQVALHGDDPEHLVELARVVEERLAVVEGALDVMGPDVAGAREARVLVDPGRSRDLGLSPREVGAAVGFALRGARLPRLRRPEGEVEIVIGVPEKTRPGLAALKDLPLPREGGGIVPLGSVATVELGKTPPDIQRNDRRTSQWVGVQFDAEKVTTEQGRERIRAALAGLAMPPGYSWDFGQQGDEHDEALGVMARGVGLSLLVVVLLMAALFESVLQPLAIVITLPLAFFGAFWALWLTGHDLEVIGFTGLVILIGVVVNNGIVMVDHVNALRSQGISREEALLRGCGDRFRPVVMTALTTIVGLIPLAFSATTVAGAYIDSLAVVVAGGLATSTVFTLLALPAWYATVEDLGAAAVRLLPRRAPRITSGAT